MKVGYPDTMNNGAYQISPLKATEPSDAYKKLQAENKAASDRQEAFEKAIREKQSSSNTSRSNSTEPKKKRTKAGKVIKGIGSAVKGVKKAVKARKERRNDGEDDNPKVKAREQGRISRKEERSDRKSKVKTLKARNTTARQEKRQAKVDKRSAKRSGNVQAKTDYRTENINKKTSTIKTNTKSGSAYKADKKRKLDKGQRNFAVIDPKGIVSGRKKSDDSIANYTETPVNMKTPVKARSRKSGDINYKKADRLNKRVDRLEKRLEKSGIKKAKGGSYTGNEGYVGDSRREIRVRKQDRKAGAAAGYGNMDEAKFTAKLDKTLAKKGYKRKEIKSPTKFASNAQRKAVWASKNEKKKNK